MSPQTKILISAIAGILAVGAITVGAANLTPRHAGNAMPAHTGEPSGVGMMSGGIRTGMPAMHEALRPGFMHQMHDEMVAPTQGS